MTKTKMTRKEEKVLHKHFFYDKNLDQRIRMFFVMDPDQKISYQKLIEKSIEFFLDHKGVPKEFPQPQNSN